MEAGFRQWLKFLFHNSDFFLTILRLRDINSQLWIVSQNSRI